MACILGYVVFPLERRWGRGQRILASSDPTACEKAEARTPARLLESAQIGRHPERKVAFRKDGKSSKGET